MTVREPVRVAIVEDEPLLRGLLEATLSRLADFAVTATFQSAEEALAGLAADMPDVLLCDIELGTGMDGIALAKRLRKEHPTLGIAILSNHADVAYLEALRVPLGKSWAYLLKKSALSVDALERTIRSVAAGLVVFDPDLVAAARPDPGRAKVQGRPALVLEMIAQGYSNATIAAKLSLTERSVERLVGQLYQELGIDVADTAINPRVQAALAFLADAAG